MVKSAPFLALVLLSYSLNGCKDSPSSPQSVHQSVALQLGGKEVADKIADKAYSHTETILGFGHRQPESAGLAQSRAYVIAELKKHGWTSVEQKFKAKTPNGDIQYSNVIARYAPNPGQNPWSRNVTGVLAAHIDSKILPNFLGADDAASSVASIVALAEHLHKNQPAAAKQLELAFFDGEEAVGPNMAFQVDGLYGSIHYSRAVQSSVAQAVSPYRKAPQFGIVLDMIGHQNLNIKIPSDTPKQLTRSYDDARNKLGLKNHFGKSSGSFLDDHYPMIVIANIPTIDLIGDFSANKWWHTSADSMDIISKKSLSMSIHMTMEILSNHL
jgi:glutaminyl-peptide cyclotransferase